MKNKSYNSKIKESSSEIVKALLKQVQSKSLKVRISSFGCLAELSRATQFGMDEHIEELFPLLSQTVNETQSFEPVLYSLKILLRLFRSYEVGQKCHFFALCDQITEMLVRGLSHDYSKIISESLYVTSAFLSALKDEKTLVI